MAHTDYILVCSLSTSHIFAEQPRWNWIIFGSEVSHIKTSLRSRSPDHQEAWDDETIDTSTTGLSQPPVAVKHYMYIDSI